MEAWQQGWPRLRRLQVPFNETDSHLCAPWSRSLKENSLSWPLQSQPSTNPPPASWLVQGGGGAGVLLPETWEPWRELKCPTGNKNRIHNPFSWGIAEFNSARGERAKTRHYRISSCVGERTRGLGNHLLLLPHGQGHLPNGGQTHSDVEPSSPSGRASDTCMHTCVYVCVVSVYVHPYV